MRKQRGFTILELLVSLFICFIALCAMAAVMISSYSFLRQIQDKATLIQLARLSADEGIFSGNATQFESYPNYKCSRSDAGYLTGVPFMGIYHATVTGPAGNSIQFEVGSRDLKLGGCCVSDTGMVAFGLYKGGYRARVFDDVAGSVVGADFPFMPVRKYNQPGNIPVYGTPGGMACDPDFTTLYVSDIGCGGVFVLPSGGRTWDGNPIGTSSIAMAIDWVTNTVWGTVSDAHEAWSEPMADIDVHGANVGTFPKSPMIQLDCPSVLAQDPTTRDIWVVDESMMCLRHRTSGGAWEPFEYKPVTPVATRMVTPKGIAFTSANELVVVDGRTIWTFTGYTGGVLVGKQFALPNTLLGQIHSLAAPHLPVGGIDYVYMTDYNDHLWRFQVPDGPLVQRN